MKTGDTVRYLNAVGGGVITKFQSKEVALVLEADGFETPVLCRELVVVSTNGYNFPVASAQTAEAPQETAAVDALQEAYTFDEADETPEGEMVSVFLAFMPHQITDLQNSPVDCYVINDSNYYLSCQLLLGKDPSVVQSINLIEPQTQLQIATIDKINLNDWETIRFQGFVYKQNKPFTPKAGIDATFRTTLSKFYKLHSFKDNDFFEQKALLLTVLKNDYPEAVLSVNPDTLFGGGQKDTPVLPDVLPKLKPTLPTEVDLHISALTDSTAGMSNGDMLEMQLDKFNEVMHACRKNRGHKIVFIHGKGEGVLRKAIEKELRSKYSRCDFQDASFQQYGFGATQVTIR
ncbi:MAG: DUF2027 domain-containing protein [Prevotellaceae bacterium]|jgi:hypothetical protein|nr:DUF2027 domain-containing protein [Prevotellaceae bacterium]